MSHFVWDMNPIMIKIFSIEVRWYGVFFSLSILLGFNIFLFIFKREKQNINLVDPLLYLLVGCMLIGSRLAHCLFYEPQLYLANPLSILKIWEGGLASHGGIAGIFLAIFIFTKRHPEFSKLYLLDRLAVASMIGACFIRLGNFFNSEILGIPSNSPFAIIFKRIGPQPLHPAQLYEAAAYFIIFIILAFLYFKSNVYQKDGMALGITMILVFITRFAVEFVKSSQSTLDGVLSMGQYLSIPFIIFGIYLVVRASIKKHL